ncbi:MAG: tyrosine-type recombinase/integrase [Candidatus Dormiibacterota bacterium]
MKTPLSDLATEVQAYLDHCRLHRVKPSTIKHSYGYSLFAVLLPWCQGEGITSAASIDQDTLNRYSAAIRGRTKRDGSPLADNTVWTYQKATKQFVKWYANVHKTTAPKLRLRQPPGRKVITLGRDQIALLEHTAETERDRVIIRLLADTGMRSGELVSITKGDLRREGPRHYVRITSSTDGRDVPITGEMYARLRALAHGGDDEPIFIGQRRDRRTGEREALTVPGVRQMVSALALNAGIRSAVNPYVFRHSACRWLLMSGQSTIVVGMILGHGSEAMIREHYNDLGSDDAHDRLMRVLRAERS